VPKRGLPETLRMRHDEHYVEALAASGRRPCRSHRADRSAGPEPQPAAQVMGDLSELMASVAEKGIIEPLIVRQRARATRLSLVNGGITPPSRSVSEKCQSSSARSMTQR
jgi:ParB family chromosome partitioning protein